MLINCSAVAFLTASLVDFLNLIEWNKKIWQADLGYIWQAIIEVKVPNSSHVASIQHRRVD